MSYFFHVLVVFATLNLDELLTYCFFVVGSIGSPRFPKIWPIGALWQDLGAPEYACQSWLELTWGHIRAQAGPPNRLILPPQRFLHFSVFFEAVLPFVRGFWLHDNVWIPRAERIYFIVSFEGNEKTEC